MSERIIPIEGLSIACIPEIQGVELPPREAWPRLNHGSLYELKTTPNSHKALNFRYAAEQVGVDQSMILTGSLVREEELFNQDIRDPILTACSKARQCDPNLSELETNPDVLRVANDVMMGYFLNDGTLLWANKPDQTLPQDQLFDFVAGLVSQTTTVRVFSADAVYSPYYRRGFWHGEQYDIELNQVPQAFIALYTFGAQGAIERGLATTEDYELYRKMASNEQEAELLADRGVGLEQMRKVNAGVLMQKPPFRNAWKRVNGHLIGGPGSYKEVASATMAIKGMTSKRMSMLADIKGILARNEMVVGDVVVGGVVEKNTHTDAGDWQPWCPLEEQQGEFLLIPTQI